MNKFLMEASTTFQLEGWPSELIHGFDLTEKYIVAVGKSCIVHSLDCEQCRCKKGQMCLNHQAVFDIGLICDVKCHPTSNIMLIAGDEAGQMELWDLENGTRIRTFLGHNTLIGRVLFLNSDSKYASGSEDGTVILWSREEAGPSSILRGHTKTVVKLEIRNNFLFSGSEDVTTRIWDIDSGACVRVLEGYSGYTSILTFSPDNSVLRAGSGRNGKIRSWDWVNGKLIMEVQTEARDNNLLIDIDGNLVTGGLDGSVRTWAQDGTHLKSFSAHEKLMQGIVQAGKFLITIGSIDGMIKVWDWESEKWLFDLQEPVQDGMIAKLVMSHGKLATASWSGSRQFHKVQVWDLGQIQELALRHAVRED